MRSRFARLAGLLLIAILAALGACTPKHTNMLIFGTDTKIALDISASQTTEVPYITLGWRREEIALVPLLANAPAVADLSVSGAGGTAACGEGKACAGAGTLFQGQDKDTNNISRIDAYSTIASFGANLDASAAAGAVANGSIATFFATGVAAQKLADLGGAQLVSTKAAPPGNTGNTFSSADSSKALATALNDPTKGDACYAAVQQWMKNNKITDGITLFTLNSKYDTQRTQALQDSAVKPACT